jgi:hypothetical protein
MLEQSMAVGAMKNGFDERELCKRHCRADGEAHLSQPAQLKDKAWPCPKWERGAFPILALIACLAYDYLYAESLLWNCGAS